MNWGHSVQESNWKPCTVLIRPSDLTIKNQKHFVVKMAIVPLMSLSPLFLGNRVLSLFSIAVCWKKKKKPLPIHPCNNVWSCDYTAVLEISEIVWKTS